EAVWRNVHVTEDSLTRCISEVRSALGDGDQTVIKNVPRRGYILATPVIVADRAAAQPVLAGTEPKNPVVTGTLRARCSRLRGPHWAGAATVLVLLLGLAIWFAIPSHRT